MSFQLLPLILFIFLSIDAHSGPEGDGEIKRLKSDIEKSFIDEQGEFHGLGDAKSLEDFLQKNDFLKKRSVKFEDIKSWQLLADRYAAGKDVKGEVIAIYDLSYPSLNDHKHFKQTVLASFGIGHYHLGTLIKKLKNLLKREGVQGNTDKKALKLLHKLSKREGKTKDLKGWHKNIIWKSGQAPALGLKGAPLSFSFDQIDLKAMSKDKFKLEKNMAKVDRFFSSILGEDELQGSFLKLFKVEQIGQNLTLMFDHSALLPKKNRPKKIVDIRYYKSSYTEAALFVAAKLAIKASLSAISAPLVSNLLQYAVVNWMDHYKAQKQAHSWAVLELINQCELGSNNNAFCFLDRDKRRKAGNYIVNSQASTWTVLRRLFTDREKTWVKSLQKDIKVAARSRQILQSQGKDLEDITPWFALARSAQGHKKIHMLARPQYFTHYPKVAIDYQGPEREILWRYNALGVEAILSFINITPLLVGDALNLITSYAISRPIRAMKRQEARLKGHFLYAAWNEGVNFDREIELLNQRRLNPFEVSIKAENKLILERMRDLEI